MRLALLVGMLALGCASPPPRPASVASAPPSEARETRAAAAGEALPPVDDKSGDQQESASDPAASPAPAEPVEPAPAPSPTTTIELQPKPTEPESPAPEERASPSAPAGESPPAEGGHPLPRVIVEIVKVKGPHKAASIQRIARRSLWGRIIECYRLGAHKNQSLKGKTSIRFQVSKAGKASRAKATGSTLPDKEVVTCLAKEVNTLELDRAKAGSSVTATIQIYPGDAPMSPPPSAKKARQ